jgi:2,3-bisphosphoglycerate-independent phosphoglycerate mutase
MVPSPRDVATYDEKPAMSADLVADAVLEAVATKTYDFILVNFANPDMVGHTGNLEAAIEAVTTVDRNLGRLTDAVLSAGGALVITADHGNCELMKDPATGGPHTSHTTNPVPVVVMSSFHKSIKDGSLADLAPTVLDLMGIPIPREMTGHSILHADAARAAE